MSEGAVVVVGASVAGVTTADRLRKFGHTGPITLVDGEGELPYDKPPLSKQLLSGTQTETDVRLRPREHFTAAGVELRLGVRVHAVDPDRRLLTTSSGEIGYDALVVATGVRPAVPAGWGSPPTIRTLDDVRGMRERWRAAGSLVVVGGGFLGLEVAASAVGRGLDVTVVEAQPLPLLSVVGETVGRRVVDIHAAAGVRMRTGVPVAAVRQTSGGWHVDLADGTTVTADDAVVAVGTVPNLEWLASSGVEATGGVGCDARCRTAVPGVYAVGDVATVEARHLGERLRVEHWTNALDTAQVAARDLAGAEPAELPAPYFWSHQYGHRLQMLGRPEPADRCHLVPRPGRAEDDAALYLYERDGRAVAALTHNWPTALARVRGRLRHLPPIGELLDTVTEGTDEDHSRRTALSGVRALRDGGA